MKLYFDFFNDKKETKYICLTDINNKIDINLDKFNLTAYLDNDIGIDYNDITDFFLIIEKEINGVYILEKKITGIYNSGIVEYENCNFDDVISNSANYRLYFQFNQGGIVSYNGKDKVYFVNLKTKCEEFNMEIYDSILIEDYYELQNIDIDIPKITFKMSIINNKNFNNYRYYYKITNTELNDDIKVDYKILDKNELIVSEGISAASFKDDITYLHFYLKDIFDNTSYKVFKITTKQNTLTLFEILNKEISIRSDEEFSIFYNCRNIESITPVIEIKNEQNVTKKYVSEKVIGLKDKLKNVIQFKISDYFEEKFNNYVNLYFILNKNENNISNSIMILIDSVPPILTITNFEDNYKLITTDETVINVMGKIQDDNFFYLGNNRQKSNLKQAKHYLLLNSNNNNIYSVSFNGNKKIEFLKYSKYYITESLGEDFEIYDKEDNLIDPTEYTYINDFTKEGTKNIYILFDKRKLSQYELNIIENQNGLVVKGSELLSVINKQFFGEIACLYYLKIEINQEIKDTFEFDVGIDEFSYSFLPKINFSNISCNLTNKKEMVTDFLYSNFIPIKSNIDLEITKFTNNKIIYKQQTITCDELTFTTIALKEDEFFSADKEVMFFDDTLNSFPFEEIYSYPKIYDKNKNEIECLNYKVSEIDTGVYSFSFNIKLQNGLNMNTIEYSDSIGNTTTLDFIVEKNTEPVILEIDELYNKSFNKYIVSDNEYELTTNKKIINVKFIIKNETYKDIQDNNSYIIIKSENNYKKQKILTEENQRIVYIEFSNLNEIKEVYKAYYNNDVKENITFSIINIPTLRLNSVTNFVTGFNYYYLKFDTDNFANIKLQYDNKNFICKLNNNIVEVTRVNNSNFLEKIEIELITSDKYNLYTPVSKKINGIFYNSSVIQDYTITGLHNNKVINPQFDLSLKSYDADNIDYIVYYDKLEMDILKRNKYAVYDSKTQSYVINNIITPITPSYLDISIKVKNEDLIVNKRLFEEDMISLYEEKNNLVVTYVKEEDKLHIRIINKEKNNLFYNKLEIFNNGVFIKEYTNIEFSTKNNIKDYYFDIDMFEGSSKITVKLTNQFNKISFIDTELINFDYYLDLKCYINNFEVFNVLRKNDLKIELITELSKCSYYLIAKEILGTKYKFDLSEGFNDIVLEEGQYLFELYYQKNNYIKKVSTYNVEIIKDFEYIDYSREYSKYLKIDTIIVRKEINTKFDYLNPQILHYCNDELIEIYKPEASYDFIKFNIKKQYGLNRYFYKDKYHQFEMDSYNKTLEYETQDFQIFAIHTDNKSLFYSETSSSIVLDSVENLYFKTKNVDEMLIKTDRIRTVIPKTLIDNVENVLFKEFIPCNLEFYKNGVLYKTLEIKLQKDEKINIPYFSEDIKEEEQLNVQYSFKIKNNGKQFYKTTRNLYIKHSQRHFLYPYVKNIAILTNNRKFLKLSIDEQEEKIKNFSIEYFNKYKNNDINKLKEFIKIKLEENNG